MTAILITEDEAQGQRTLSAASPEEALALFDETDDIECLFTDIELRGDVQAGLDLAQAAVKKQPGLRVLYTSCHSLTDGMKALFVENSAFLPKPYTIDQLQAILTVEFGIKPHSRPTDGHSPLPEL